ncbi:MAG: family 43 glycosylhydrolase [Tepidisphaeraceae bacterium]
MSNLALAGNPILPGYYADPSVVEHDGRYFIYATLDPWGGRTLGCWESPDFKNWTYRELNWPTKEACKTATSSGAMVWAPSVIKAHGKFYMFISVGGEVWAGVADSPTGPWKNTRADNTPLVGKMFDEVYHQIDAEGFVDDDGQVYVYWGSGHNWVNGRCYVAKMNADLTGFDGQPKVVTPTNYFEGPFMIKRNGRYYLMYSNGNTTKDTYQVHYAVGDSPLGPFTEGPNSPILKTDKANHIISPGHHAVFRKGDRDFVVYHVLTPNDDKLVLRQTWVSELAYDAAGNLLPVHPKPGDSDVIQQLCAAGQAQSKPLAAIATASSSAKGYDAANAVDGSYATRWKPAGDGVNWLQLDLGSPTAVTRFEVRPEYAFVPMRFSVEGSTDGKTWSPIAAVETRTGSPIAGVATGEWRYVRLNFPAAAKGAGASVWAFEVFGK